MSLKRMAFIVGILGLLLFAGCKNDQTTATVERRLTPDFILKDTADKDFKLSENVGKVILIEFFLTTCPICRSEIAALNNLVEEYGDDGLMVIGIAIDSGNPDVVKNYIAQNDVRFRVLLDDGRVSVAYGVLSDVPAFNVIDREGWIVYEADGFHDQAQLTSAISPHL